MLRETAIGKMEPVIIDFGLANVMPSDGSKLTTRSGSVGYAAPELLKNMGHDTQIDVFSLGCIVYQMLSGLLLFDGQKKSEISSKNKIGNVSFPHSHWAEVSPAAKNFVKRLLLT